MTDPEVEHRAAVTPGTGADDALDRRDQPAEATPRRSQVRSGERIDHLAGLEEERRFLLRSLRDLDREHAAGDVDDADYETLRDGYTVRAAAVLREIEDGRRRLRPAAARDWRRIAIVTVACLAVAGGIGAVLAGAWGERSAGQEMTGATPGDETRTVLAEARIAVNDFDLVRANQLFVEADRRELERGNENAEARTYVGWTYALLARAEGAEPTDERYSIARLALDQAIEMDPTYADPHCFSAIVEYSFREDADAALGFVEECESRDPPADVSGLVTEFASEIRDAVDDPPDAP
ncbi:hypothetical protein [Ilumatobacter sp.]|uniref:hypothetical protein n=1 Tax=Ilumatobacter sp. TaxID=1967498 RepID=UPI003B5228EB